MKPKYSGKIASGKGKSADIDQPASANSYSDNNDCHSLDSDKFPKFFEINARNADSAVSSDELDVLQREIENLLFSACQRWAFLKRHVEDSSPSKVAASPKFSPKGKDLSNFGVEVAGIAFPNRPFVDTNKQTYFTDESSVDCDTPVSSSFADKMPPSSKRSLASERMRKKNTRFIPIPANDYPDKFWKFVNEFCKPCTNEDIQYLEELLSMYSEDRTVELYKRPSLGVHYKKKWNSESNNQAKGKKRKPSPNSKSSPVQIKRQRRSDSIESNLNLGLLPQQQRHLKNGLGPLTQRLLQALLEDQRADAVEFMADMESSNDSKDVLQMNGFCDDSDAAKLIKALNLPNLAILEQRIKKELIDQGLLGEEDSGDDGDNSSEDEISAELRLRQQELRMLQNTNKQRLQKLLALARLDVHRQSVLAKLDTTDKQVLELSDRFGSGGNSAAAAQLQVQHPGKLGHGSKKQSVDQQIWKTLEQREQHLAELEEINQQLHVHIT